MKFVNILKVALCVVVLSTFAGADDILEDASLDVIGLLRKYGYAAENHRVVTSDGYILNMHRCSGGPVSPPRVGKKVAFLMHGMLSSSADWVLMGPQTSLVYMLSDLGYDVWMGNSRGNRYANTHISRNNESQAFWDFSWHEIGVYDLPAMIDYALTFSGQSKLHYIGHSMGTTVYLVLISELPQYGDKIISSQLLAPAAYMHNVKSPYVIWMATYFYSFTLALQWQGTYYFEPTNEMDNAAAYNDCRDGAPFQEMCTITTFLIAGFNSQEMNRTMLPVIKAHSPAGASAMNVSFHCFLTLLWINIFLCFVYRWFIMPRLLEVGHSEDTTMKRWTITDMANLLLHFTDSPDTERQFHSITVQTIGSQALPMSKFSMLRWEDPKCNSNISCRKRHSIIWTLYGQLMFDHWFIIEWCRTWLNGNKRIDQRRTGTEYFSQTESLNYCFTFMLILSRVGTLSYLWR